MTSVDSPEQHHFDLPTLKFSIPPLRQVRRQACPVCGKVVWAYCAECIKPAPNVAPLLPPPVRLPCRISVVLHPLENRAKSTLIPGLILSPDITLIEIGEEASSTLAEYNSDPTCILLYPDSEAVSTDELDWSSVSGVLAIDATWSQAQSIRKTQLPRMRTCKLQNYRTSFWRYNNLKNFSSDDCLATIEALYYLCKEIAKTVPSPDSIEDLLFFYEAQWFRIREHHQDSDTLELGKRVRDRRRRLANNQPRAEGILLS